MANDRLTFGIKFDLEKAIADAEGLLLKPMIVASLLFSCFGIAFCNFNHYAFILAMIFSIVFLEIINHKVFSVIAVIQSEQSAQFFKTLFSPLSTFASIVNIAQNIIIHRLQSSKFGLILYAINRFVLRFNPLRFSSLILSSDISCYANNYNKAANGIQYFFSCKFHFIRVLLC